MMNISSSEEWGDTTRMGASLVGAGCPRVRIQLKPKPNRNTRVTIFPNLFMTNLWFDGLLVFSAYHNVIKNVSACAGRERGRERESGREGERERERKRERERERKTFTFPMRWEVEGYLHQICHSRVPECTLEHPLGWKATRWILTSEAATIAHW